MSAETDWTDATHSCSKELVITSTAASPPPPPAPPRPPYYFLQKTSSSSCGGEDIMFGEEHNDLMEMGRVMRKEWEEDMRFLRTQVHEAVCVGDIELVGELMHVLQLFEVIGGGGGGDQLFCRLAISRAIAFLLTAEDKTMPGRWVGGAAGGGGGKRKKAATGADSGGVENFYNIYHTTYCAIMGLCKGRKLQQDDDGGQQQQHVDKMHKSWLDAFSSEFSEAEMIEHLMLRTETPRAAELRSEPPHDWWCEKCGGGGGGRRWRDLNRCYCLRSCLQLYDIPSPYVPVLPEVMSASGESSFDSSSSWNGRGGGGGVRGRVVCHEKVKTLRLPPHRQVNEGVWERLSFSSDAYMEVDGLRFGDILRESEALQTYMATLRLVKVDSELRPAVLNSAYYFLAEDIADCLNCDLLFFQNRIMRYVRTVPVTARVVMDGKFFSSDFAAGEEVVVGKNKEKRAVLYSAMDLDHLIKLCEIDAIGEAVLLPVGQVLPGFIKQAFKKLGAAAAAPSIKKS
eukprot:GHVS01106075.1.p1 GENE.GHVS01106075.1~~GHVS01106075.1.p1  ORF type:complete len:599 (+),score=201.38 GHVS01106075.1:264-1799(+)